MANNPGTGWASTVVIGSITGIALTVDRLPERVASHFAADGMATSYMTRQAYLLFTIGLVVLLPAFVGIVIVVAARHFPRFVNLPNRDYWLAPERREATISFLTAHSAWLAALFATFAFAIHLLLIRANRAVPPRLESGPFLALMLVFSIVVVIWISALARRFRRD